MTGPFAEEDSEDNLLFEEEFSNNLPQIRAGNLNKLVERLTFDKYPDTNFVQQFLLTYRSFTNPQELLSLLKSRFLQSPPSNLAGDALSDYRAKVERNIRLRVFNLCKTWVMQHYYDFMADPEFKADFLQWLKTDVQEDISTAGQLEKKLELKITEAEAAARALSSDAAPSSSNEEGDAAPKPIAPPTRARALALLDFHPLEFARQMTLIEFEIYCKIKPWEFLGLAWTKAQAAQKAPHILDMIQWTNRITAFVASEILRAKGAKGKIATMNFFIKVVKHLYALHNFSAISAVSAGFQHASIHRLRPYWGEITKSKMTMVESIFARVASAKSFALFRAELKQTSLPLIPYLGMYLTDLTFMDEGNPDFITSPGGVKLINFSKRRRVSLVIRDIQQYQLTPYKLIPLKVIQSYIKGASTYDDETLWKVSEQTIPKGQNKLTLRELEAAEKEQGAGYLANLEKQTEALFGQASENVNFGELEHVEGYPFYDLDIQDENIITSEVDGQEVVMAGTIAKLIERLTSTQRPDPRYIESFIFSWSSFVDISTLISYLRFRFDVPMPFKSNLDLRTKYKKLVVSPTQLRVCNAMKVWVEKCNKDFLVHPNLAIEAMGLMEHISEVNHILVTTSQRVIDALRLLSEGQEPPSQRNNIYEFHKEENAFGSEDDNLLDLSDDYPFNVNCRDFAKDMFCLNEQICIEHFRPATLIDFLGDHSKYPRLFDFVSWPRRLSAWVISSIISASAPEKRLFRLQWFIGLMNELRTLRDYSSFVGVQTALSSTAILKLEVTFSRIETYSLATLSEHKDFRNSLKSYDTQVELLKTEGFSSPVVPFFPCFLSELTNIHHQPIRVKNDMINFDRARSLGAKIAELMQCQNMIYPHPPSERFVQWLGNFEESTLTEQQIDERVTQLEPQESTKLAEEQAVRDSILAFSQAVKTALIEDQQIGEALSHLLAGEADSDQSIVDFRVEMSNEIQMLTAKFVTGSDDFEELATQSLVERFGDDALSDLSEWVHPDQGGIVYGWPEQINLTLLTDASGAAWIVALQPTLTAAALSSLIRKKSFYQTCTRSNSVPLLVFTSQVAPPIHTIATQQQIEVSILRAECA